MTTTSRIPQVIDALVTTLTAALPNAEVIDGPWKQRPNRMFVTVGWTPDEDRATSTQTWAGVGNRARDERIDIPCACAAFGGGTSIATQRTAAVAMLAAVETSLRGDPMLGGAVLEPGHAQLGEFDYVPRRTANEVVVDITFHVIVTTRI